MSDNRVLVELGNNKYGDYLIKIWIDLTCESDLDFYSHIFDKLGPHEDNVWLVFFKNNRVFILCNKQVEPTNDNCFKVMSSFSQLWLTYSPYYNVLIDDVIEQDPDVDNYNKLIKNMIRLGDNFEFYFYKKDY